MNSKVARKCPGNQNITMHPQVCTRVMTALPHLLKEAPGFVEDVLQLDEVQQVLLESFFVCVDLLHLSLQHLKLTLKVNHGCMGDVQNGR